MYILYIFYDIHIAYIVYCIIYTLDALCTEERGSPCRVPANICPRISWLFTKPGVSPPPPSTRISQSCQTSHQTKNQLQDLPVSHQRWDSSLHCQTKPKPSMPIDTPTLYKTRRWNMKPCMCNTNMYVYVFVCLCQCLRILSLFVYRRHDCRLDHSVKRILTGDRKSLLLTSPIAHYRQRQQ